MSTPAPDEFAPLIALAPPAPEQQGWDTAEYTCGRCWTTVTATTEGEFARLVVEHRQSCRGPVAGVR